MMDIVAKKAESTVTADGANATATAALAAAGTKSRWRVTDFWASFDGAAVATPVVCTLTVGGVAYKFGVSTGGGSLMGNLSAPLESTTNEAPSIALAAGGAGANGHAGISAYKINADPAIPAG